MNTHFFRLHFSPCYDNTKSFWIAIWLSANLCRLCFSQLHICSLDESWEFSVSLCSSGLCRKDAFRPWDSAAVAHPWSIIKGSSIKTSIQPCALLYKPLSKQVPFILTLFCQVAWGAVSWAVLLELAGGLISISSSVSQMTLLELNWVSESGPRIELVEVVWRTFRPDTRCQSIASGKSQGWGLTRAPLVHVGLETLFCCCGSRRWQSTVSCAIHFCTRLSRQDIVILFSSFHQWVSCLPLDLVQQRPTVLQLYRASQIIDNRLRWCPLSSAMMIGSINMFALLFGGFSLSSYQDRNNTQSSQKEQGLFLHLSSITFLGPG